VVREKLFVLSPDLVLYILDPEREEPEVQFCSKAVMDRHNFRFNISDFDKVRNECSFLQSFFRRFINC